MSAHLTASTNMQAIDQPDDVRSVRRVTDVEERVARGVVAAYRQRLDWLLRVPEWMDLYAAGIVALALPGPRQGIGLQPAVLALPLENKHQLIRWTLEHCQNHVRSTIGRQVCRMLGFELFEGLDLDELLTARQWQRLREAALFGLGREHRRYKHAQQLLFTGYHQLVGQVVAQIVFRAEHRADCVQEGCLGLLAAIDRVDASSHNLRAYATTWIRRHVRNYLLRQRLPVQAPLNLIAGAVLLKSSTVANPPIGEDARDHRLQVLLLECLRHPAVSLDEPAEGGGDSLADTVPDPDALSPAQQADAADMRSLVIRRLEALTEKQRAVLVQRFGLGGATVRTLSDIARAAGISHQQAGMRERRALKRLEHEIAPFAAELYGD